MANRLARETSPYLLQHADNPVDWYPWGVEALARAEREDMPILLSIGYSACHWCHVMERESFENEDIAKQMNESFVCVKVDREERPDLDHVYQLVVQLMGRSGGWPLTVFLAPDQKPYFGGTYFPPIERYGMPGFPKVLRAAREAYRARREDVRAHSSELTRAMEQAVAIGTSTGGVSADLVLSAARTLTARFDDVHGGFGHRPKFPSTMSLDVLLRAGERERFAKTLGAMRAGGIYDQVGGGFHRYSTDEKWLVPHFEKMLYDNALLLRLYADGWRALGDDAHARTAAEIAAYVAREMTDPSGGFYTTQDADSEGEEGRFFVWRPDEIDEACGSDRDAADAARHVYGVTPEGNFEQTGATVLSIVHAPDGDAEAAALERARRLLFEAREARPKPARDDKLLASYGALMISALADASAVAGPNLLDAAVRAMTFVETALVTWDEGRRVARVARHCARGAAKGLGFLDDHAFVGDAALDVYEATGDPRWVGLARGLAEAILAHFHDAADGTFYFSPDDGEAILVRAKDQFDHSVPSASSVACRLLLRLGTLVDPKLTEHGTRAVERMATAAAEHPSGMSSAVALVHRLVRGSVDVVLVGPRSSEATRALAREVLRAHLPDRVVAWADPTDPKALDACRALTADKPSHAVPVAYVCRGRSCSAPLSDPRELAALLASPR
ncbi:MAG TPA: thioredoxin domain-containing protein [Polyangiaceae bacterium]|jgi:hypothetical protein